MRRLVRAILVVALLGVVACSRPPATVVDLRMPPQRHAGVAAVSTRLLAVEGDESQSPQSRNTAELLRRSGIVGSANYRYQLAAPGKGRYKVRVDMFADEARAQANWQARHMPEALAMTTPLAVGDAGWIYRDQMAGVRIGRVIIEVRAADGAQSIADFVSSYADFIRETMARGGPGWWERGRSTGDH